MDLQDYNKVAQVPISMDNWHSAFLELMEDEIKIHKDEAHLYRLEDLTYYVKISKVFPDKNPFWKLIEAYLVQGKT